MSSEINGWEDGREEVEVEEDREVGAMVRPRPGDGAESCLPSLEWRYIREERLKKKGENKEKSMQCYLDRVRAIADCGEVMSENQNTAGMTLRPPMLDTCFTTMHQE